MIYKSKKTLNNLRINRKTKKLNLTKMENIKVKRKELIMENYIVRVENIFANLLGIEEKGIPDNIKALHKFDFDE
jgi:hypothetical protein